MDVKLLCKTLNSCWASLYPGLCRSTEVNYFAYHALGLVLLNLAVVGGFLQYKAMTSNGSGEE